jgi:hypothetical protein
VAGSDAVGDAPNVIDVDNQDRFPLMGRFETYTMMGENVTVLPISSVSLTFEQVAMQGLTTVNRTLAGPDPSSGFKIADQYFEITTTANYSGIIKIRIAYDDSRMSQEEEEGLKILHWDEALLQWVNATVGLDTVNNVIYGETGSFSVFAVAVPLIHDSCVTRVIACKTSAGQGFNLRLNVTLINHGDYPEILNVSIYAGAGFVASQTIELASRTSRTVTFVWNTTGFAYGNYTLSAFVSPVLGEVDLADNTVTGGWVFVSIPGDINLDRKVDLKDVFAVGKAYGTTRERPDPSGRIYVIHYDINDDGKIDLKDYYTTCKNYGKSWE